MIALPPEEIREVTGRVRYKAQARQLCKMGIPFRIRGDGSLFVKYSDLDENPKDKVTEPDFSSLTDDTEAA